MNRNRKLGFCYPGYRYCGLVAQDQVSLRMLWIVAVNCMMNAMHAMVAQSSVMNCFNNASAPI